MRIGDKIVVRCMDNGRNVDGVVHRMTKDAITVVLGKGDVTVTMVRKGTTNNFIGAKGGLEFTVTLL